MNSSPSHTWAVELVFANPAPARKGTLKEESSTLASPQHQSVTWCINPNKPWIDDSNLGILQRCLPQVLGHERGALNRFYLHHYSSNPAEANALSHMKAGSKREAKQNRSEDSDIGRPAAPAWYNASGVGDVIDTAHKPKASLRHGFRNLYQKCPLPQVYIEEAKGHTEIRNKPDGDGDKNDEDDDEADGEAEGEDQRLVVDMMSTASQVSRFGAVLVSKAQSGYVESHQYYIDQEYYDRSHLKKTERIPVSEVLTHIFLFLPASTAVLGTVSAVSHAWRDRAQSLPQWIITHDLRPQPSAIGDDAEGDDKAKADADEELADIVIGAHVPPQISMSFHDLEVVAAEAREARGGAPAAVAPLVFSEKPNSGADAAPADRGSRRSTREGFIASRQHSLVNAMIGYQKRRETKVTTRIYNYLSLCQVLWALAFILGGYVLGVAVGLDDFMFPLAVYLFPTMYPIFLIIFGDVLLVTHTAAGRDKKALDEEQGKPWFKFMLGSGLAIKWIASLGILVVLITAGLAGGFRMAADTPILNVTETLFRLANQAEVSSNEIGNPDFSYNVDDEASVSNILALPGRYIVTWQQPAAGATAALSGPGNRTWINVSLVPGGDEHTDRVNFTLFTTSVWPPRTESEENTSTPIAMVALASNGHDSPCYDQFAKEHTEPQDLSDRVNLYRAGKGVSSRGFWSNDQESASRQVQFCHNLMTHYAPGGPSSPDGQKLLADPRMFLKEEAHLYFVVATFIVLPGALLFMFLAYLPLTRFGIRSVAKNEEEYHQLLFHPDKVQPRKEETEEGQETDLLLLQSPEDRVVASRKQQRKNDCETLIWTMQASTVGSSARKHRENFLEQKNEQFTPRIFKMRIAMGLLLLLSVTTQAGLLLHCAVVNPNAGGVCGLVQPKMMGNMLIFFALVFGGYMFFMLQRLK